MYPPFAGVDHLPRLGLFVLGVMSLAPYSLANWGGDIRNFFARFTSPDGIVIFAWPGTSSMLSTYCRERFAGDLHEEEVVETRWFRQSRVACLSGGGDVPLDARRPPS